MSAQKLNSSPLFSPISAPGAQLRPWDFSSLDSARTILFKKSLSLGKSQDCELSLTDPLVCRHHARIDWRGSGYCIRDLGSLNGTYVNGTQVIEALLTENDRIRLGNTEFLFLQKNSPVELHDPLLFSRNPSWRSQLISLPNLAQTELPLLILGDSGTGKELLARRVHQLSRRASGPFVSVNCSALSESLVESELFGHRKGSFTGAERDRRGAFESAKGGTLFLDEVGDLSSGLQPKLLRALENQEVRPVGSDRTLTTDVRILAATHKNLAEQVEAGTFRLDLYYRLNVLSLSPPPLRERAEDFEDLLYRFGREYRVSFSIQAIRSLKSYAWPGNIRELKNFVARCAAYLGPKSRVEDSDLKRFLQPQPFPTPSPASEAQKPFSRSGSVIREIEKDLILSRLKANQGNQRKTAYDLGIPKSTLSDRIKSYGLKTSEDFKASSP